MSPGLEECVTMPPKVPEEVLEEIRAALAAATPGPWLAQGRELFQDRRASGKMARPLLRENFWHAGDAALCALLMNWVGPLLEDYRGMREALRPARDAPAGGGAP